MTSEDLSSFSVSEVFFLALTFSSDDEGEAPGWDAIAELHKRGGSEIFALAQSLCQGDDSHERDVGACILGQLGWKDDYPFRDQTLPILFHLLETDSNVLVLLSACHALGHLRDECSIEHVLPFVNHPHEDVRFSAVSALSCLEDERAINGLIQLSRDSDSDVRDWATFGLGSLIDTDTEAIRQALYERLSDTDEDTVGEAIVGLARRKDERVKSYVLKCLEQMLYGTLHLEAAEELADPGFLPALYHFRENWEGEKNWIYDRLIDAIAACEGHPNQD